MRKTRRILLLYTVLTVAALLAGCGSDDPASPAGGRGTILVLGDGGTEGHVMATLKGAGFTVRDGGLFHEYTGDGLQGVDAVVLLAGVDYDHDMVDAGETALVAFVGAGGGLLTTEWLTYSGAQDGYHSILRNILPVYYGGSYANGTETYTVMEDHPVTAGLPATFPTGSGNQYSVVGMKIGAKQLVRGDRSGAALVTWRKGGRVVSWNMGGEYGGGEVWTADIDRLLVNAAGYCAGEGRDPARTSEFTLATSYLNVTYDGDAGSEGDFYITMEILDRTAGAVLAQDRVLYQVPDGRVVSPGMALEADLPMVDGQMVTFHVSIYENDPGGPQDIDVYEKSYTYDYLKDCWTAERTGACGLEIQGTLSLRSEPGESTLRTDLNWTLAVQYVEE